MNMENHDKKNKFRESAATAYGGGKMRILKKILMIAAVLLLGAGWLYFACRKWDSARLFRQNISAGYIDRIFSLFTAKQGVASGRIYLDLAPLLFFAFWLTVLVPDTAGRFVKWTGTIRLIYRIASAVLVLFAALLMILSASTLHTLLFKRTGKGLTRFISWAKGVYPALSPVSAVLAAATWLLPCAGKVLAEWFHEPKRAGSELARTGISAGICIMIGLLVTAASASMMAVLNSFSKSAVQYVDRFCRNDAFYIGMCIVSVIFAPIIEEVAFRGLIQRHLRKAGMPYIAALLITAVFFGVWHRNLGQFVYTVMFALIVGTVYEYCGRIRYTVLIHFCLNFVTILAYSDNSSDIFGKLKTLPAVRKTLMNMKSVPAGFCFAAFIGAVVLLLILFAKVWRKSPGLSPKTARKTAETGNKTG